mgnify:CR=1 FL=1
MVYPSGGAFATRAAPMVPPAPPTFSTMIVRLEGLPHRDTEEPRHRVGRPARREGTTTVMGFRG